MNFCVSLLRFQALRPSLSTPHLIRMATTVGGNRLSKERSPYLLQHASNPVNWFPWGVEAFRAAREENKLIFLSVGYSTCHWCHVMERESFENPEIGSILNQNFVSIKVDREERPDVDQVYMTFVHATCGSGGWPMSVWLTPDLKPIVGGTYFPPNDDPMFGRPGFKTILRRLADQWKNNREQMLTQGNEITSIISKASTLKPETNMPNVSCAEKCFKALERRFDPVKGGFGEAPKFPQCVNFNFLFRYYADNPSTDSGKTALKMCLTTLDMIARGGICDHVSNGFHRYSTDDDWHVPHFEKMLYDQAQLAVAYSDAYQITRDVRYANVIRNILTYVNRDLSHPEGGFYSAEDADSLPTSTDTHKKEGAFCVWTHKEIIQHLENLNTGSSADAPDVFCYHFGVKPDGNVNPRQDPHGELVGKNVLIERQSIDETAAHFSVSKETVQSILDESKKCLHEVRRLRPFPHKDTKILAAWNGLMLSGFARAGQVLSDDNFTTRAEQAASFLREHLFVESSSSLLRSCYADGSGAIKQTSTPIDAFCDDYAFIIRGLLDLYELDLNNSWLDWALKLQNKQNELFWDSSNGGYFRAKVGDDSIVIRMKDDQDGAEPAANSVSALNLLRLSNITDKSEFSMMAKRILLLYSERINSVPVAVPEMVTGLMQWQKPSSQIVLVAPDCDNNNEGVKEMLQCVHSLFIPGKVVVFRTESDKSSPLPIHVKAMKCLNNRPTAFVCKNFACSEPVNSTADLLNQLK